MIGGPDDLLPVLTRLRWRARAGGALRGGLAAAGVLTALWPFTIWRPSVAWLPSASVSILDWLGSPGGRWTALAVVAASAAAGAWRQTPSLRAVAAAADARHSLDDRLLTALQHLGDTDGAARLLVRDAAAHAAQIRPADVFPLRPARAGVFAMSAVVLGTAAALTLAGSRADAGPPAAGTSAPAAGAPQPSAAGGQPAREATMADAAGAAAGVAPAAATLPSAPAHTSSSPGLAAQPERAGGRAAASSPRTDGVEPDSAPPPSQPPGPPGSRDAAGSAAGSDGAGTAAHGHVPGAGAHRSAASPDTVLGAGGLGVPANGMSGRSGGVGGSTAALSSGSGDRPAPAGGRRPRPIAATAAAAARADAAIAAGDTPPGLRHYVRAYFTAISR